MQNFIPLYFKASLIRSACNWSARCHSASGRSSRSAAVLTWPDVMKNRTGRPSASVAAFRLVSMPPLVHPGRTASSVVRHSLSWPKGRRHAMRLQMGRVDCHRFRNCCPWRRGLPSSRRRCPVAPSPSADLEGIPQDFVPWVRHAIASHCNWGRLYRSASVDHLGAACRCPWERKAAAATFVRQSEGCSWASLPAEIESRRRWQLDGCQLGLNFEPVAP